jgi:hypothetical protein
MLAFARHLKNVGAKFKFKENATSAPEKMIFIVRQFASSVTFFRMK